MINLYKMLCTWTGSVFNQDEQLTEQLKDSVRFAIALPFVTGVSGNDFWGFGNGKGIEKAHSRNSGTGRELKKPIPEIWEREGNKKIHSQI